MNNRRGMKPLLLLLAGALFISASRADAPPDTVWPRLIRLTLRPENRDADIKKLLTPFGLAEGEIEDPEKALSDKRYDSLLAISDPGDPKSEVRAVELLVPAGQETRWLELLRRLPEVKSSERVPYVRRGASDDAAVNAARGAQANSQFINAPPSTTTSLLKEIENQLRTHRLKDCDVVRDPLISTATNRRVLRVVHAKNQVMNKYWQDLVIDVLLLPSSGEQLFNVSVDGQYAPGGGNIPPPLADFHPLLPEFYPEVELYRQRLAEDIQNIIENASSTQHTAAALGLSMPAGASGALRECTRHPSTFPSRAAAFP